MKTDEKKILEKLKTARGNCVKRNYSAAIKLYTELTNILHDDPKNLTIIKIELGWSYYNHQKFSEAIEHLNSALQSDQLNAQQRFDCYRIIGFSYEMLGNVKDAILHLKKSLQIDIPEGTKRYAYFELGKLLYTSEQIIEAEHYFNRAYSLFQDNEKEYVTSLFYYMGFVDYFQKRYTEASKKFDYVVQNATDHKTKAGGYFGLAHIYYHSKDFVTLIDLCEKILRLDPEFFDKETLGFFMCESFLNLKNWNELESYYAELKKNYPGGKYKEEYKKFELVIKSRKTPKI